MSEKQNKKRKQDSMAKAEPSDEDRPLTKRELIDVWEKLSYGSDITADLQDTQEKLESLLGKKSPLLDALKSIEMRVSALQDIVYDIRGWQQAVPIGRSKSKRK